MLVSQKKITFWPPLKIHRDTNCGIGEPQPTTLHIYLIYLYLYMNIKYHIIKWFHFAALYDVDKVRTKVH